MFNIVYKLPTADKKIMAGSWSYKEKIFGYLQVQHFGYSYYFPITRKHRKLFGFKIKKGRIIMDYDLGSEIDDFVRDMIGALYCQVRDVVGSGIHRDLSTQIEEGFNKMFSKKLDLLLENKMPKALPEAKEG